MQLSEKLEHKTDLLTEESKNKIDIWTKKFPEDKKQSALLPSLFIAQEQNGGHLTKDLVAAVADYLDIPRITAEESATFYSMYEHKPVGKHKICVCTVISCYLCGSDNIVAHLKRRLGIGFGETTADGKFTLKEVECLGACVNAPMFQINDTYYENLDIDKVDKILDSLN